LINELIYRCSRLLRHCVTLGLNNRSNKFITDYQRNSHHVIDVKVVIDNDTITLCQRTTRSVLHQYQGAIASAHHAVVIQIGVAGLTKVAVTPSKQAQRKIDHVNDTIFVEIASARQLKEAGKPSRPRNMAQICQRILKQLLFTAFRVFIPSIFVYALFQITLGVPIRVESLQAIPALFLIILFISGLAMFAATAQVYFRDTQALMPFILRLTMFISPVLYYPEQAKALFDGRLLTIFNPLFCMIQIFSGSIVRGDTFDGWTWFMAIFWATVSFVGGFWFLVSREGEFAARI
jgi:hypothetical protein